MIEAYEAALREISRRREFMSTFYEQYLELEETVRTENITRHQFLNKYGKVIPFKFVPGLNSILPDVPDSANFSNDMNLPSIDGYHNSCDNKITQKPNNPIMSNRKAAKELQVLKAELMSLKNFKKDKGVYIKSIESQNLKLKHRINMLKNDVENLKFLKEMSEEKVESDPLSPSKFEDYRVMNELKSTKNLPYMKKILSHATKKIFNYMNGILVAKNNSIMDLKMALNEKQKNYDQLLDEQRERNEKKRGEMIQRIEDLNRRLLEARGMYQRCDSELSELRSVYNIESDDYKREIEDLNRKVEGLENTKRRLEDTIYNLKGEIRKYENKGKNDDFQNEKNEELRMIRMKMERLEDKVRDLEGEKIRIETQLKEKALKMETMMNDLETAEMTKENAMTQMKMIKKENEKLKTKTQSLSKFRQESMMKESDTQSPSSSSMKMLQSDLEDLKAELEAKDVKYENMKLLLDSADKDAQRLKNKLKIKDEEMRDLIDKLDALQQEYVNLQEDSNMIKEELETRNSLITDKKKQLEEDLKIVKEQLEYQTSELYNKQSEIEGLKKVIEDQEDQAKERKQLQKKNLEYKKAVNFWKESYGEILDNSLHLHSLMEDRIVLFVALAPHIWAPLTLTQKFEYAEKSSELTSSDIEKKINE